MSNVSQSSVSTPTPGAVKPLDYAPEKVAKSAWSPLGVPIFRALWVAYMVSLIGTWAREAGGPWLMTELTKGKADQNFWVSLIQTAGNLPICLLSIAAGVLADIYDRRKLLILTNIWMLLASALLGAVTLGGWTTPHLLLAFTFILGMGAALAGPAFQYVIPELVPPSDLPLAIALNSVALNVARAVGPALGMLIVIFVGKFTDTARSTGASFLANALAFVGVIWVLLRWHRGAQKQPAHRETLWGATKTAFKYTAHSAALRAILVRVAAFILCAVIVWAQLAIIAKKQLNGKEGTFLILMAAVGVGAVIGVFFMPRMDKRLSTEGMVAVCTVAFGLALMGLSQCKGPLANIWLAGALAMIVGFNWVIVPTNFNIATQRSVPGWVKGRAIAMYMTVLFGSFAVGSPIWGALSSKINISNASLIAGALVCLGALLVIPFPLTRARGNDFSPANLPIPAAPADFDTGAGGVELAYRYEMEASKAQEFMRLAHHDLKPCRLRNGAARWHLSHHTGENGVTVFEERFAFNSWADRLRHHARTTKHDAQMEEQVRALHRAAELPPLTYTLIPFQTVQPSNPRGLVPPPPMIGLDIEHILVRFLQELENIFGRLFEGGPVNRYKHNNSKKH